MERKEKYIAPAILEELKIEMEGAILYQSVVSESTTIESVGQEVEIHEDPLGYNWEHNWEWEQ